MFRHIIIYAVIQMKNSENIDSLRKKLYKSIDENGINAEQTMKISKELDKLIQEYFNKINKEPIGKTNYDIAYNNLKKVTKQFGEFPTVKGWNKYAIENNLLSSNSMEYISGLNWNKLRRKIFSEI